MLRKKVTILVLSLFSSKRSMRKPLPMQRSPLRIHRGSKEEGDLAALVHNQSAVGNERIVQ